MTLSWTAGSADYVIVPRTGRCARCERDCESNGTTTTYTLYATNQYGRTTATVTVSVP